MYFLNYFFTFRLGCKIRALCGCLFLIFKTLSVLSYIIQTPPLKLALISGSLPSCSRNKKFEVISLEGLEKVV